VSGSVVCHRQFKELWRGRDGTGRSRSLIREVNLANGFRCVEKFCMTEEKKLEGKWLVYSWLQKNGNCQNKIDTFLQFFHSVKPSYER
jgi:hypothetical protein